MSTRNRNVWVFPRRNSRVKTRFTVAVQLVAHGLDVNARNKRGMTPLDIINARQRPAPAVAGGAPGTDGVTAPPENPTAHVIQFNQSDRIPRRRTGRDGFRRPKTIDDISSEAFGQSLRPDAAEPTSLLVGHSAVLPSDSPRRCGVVWTSAGRRVWRP